MTLGNCVIASTIFSNPVPVRQLLDQFRTYHTMWLSRSCVPNTLAYTLYYISLCGFDYRQPDGLKAALVLLQTATRWCDHVAYARLMPFVHDAHYKWTDIQSVFFPTTQTDS